MSRRVLLLAHPVGHTLSPVMHEAAFRHLGIDAHYRAVDVTPAGLEQAVRALRAPAVAGANVTIPHKRAVVAWLDGLTEAARRVGAVNTVVPADGGLMGDNTDVEGLSRALAELSVELAGSAAVVIGAGGAARAAVLALLDAGAEVALYNRSRARAERLASELAPAGRVRLLEAAALTRAVRAAGVLVQATPVGMQGVAEGLSPLPVGVLPQAGAVVDLVYRPRETALLAAAKAAGLPVQNGLPMLVHQGALALERWFAVAAPVAVMRQAAEAGLG